MVMSFCDHCEGQRFDRAQVLRALRATRRDLRNQARACSADEALRMAIEAVTALDIPHLEVEEAYDEQTVH
jgi:imidazolonepropionase-like amidohydrolase